MSTKTFDEFVKKRLNEAEASQSAGNMDWNRTREEWIQSLRDLYSTMEGYLKRYTEAGQIHVKREKVQLSEQYLGSYEAEKLTFEIGMDKIVAKPVGRLMIGATGRVDLIGARGTLRLVLLDKGGPVIRTRIEIGGRIEEESSRPLIPGGEVSECGWYIATLPPRVTTTPLNADTFRDALVELSDV